MSKQQCPQCGEVFDVADRAQPTAPPGSVVQIVYCSDTCKKKAANARYYANNAELVKSRVIANRKKQKRIS